MGGRGRQAPFVFLTRRATLVNYSYFTAHYAGGGERRAGTQTSHTGQVMAQTWTGIKLKTDSRKSTVFSADSVSWR